MRAHHGPRTARSGVVAVLACLLAWPGHTVAQSGAQTDTAEPAPSLAACRARFGVDKASEPACLRLVYTRPSSDWPAPHVDAGVAWRELAPLPDTPPHPADNPSTPARIALGRRLFEDPKLSHSGQIACANCHDPQLGWGDGRSVSFGHDRKTGRRNSIGLQMSGFMRTLFWDGRADSLEAQALHPLVDGVEMANRSVARAVRRVRRDPSYRTQFREAYGDAPLDAALIAKSLATFQRSLAPRRSRLDRFLEGSDTALSDRQLLGLHLFRTRARCMNCHSGPEMTDHSFHNLGLHFYGRERQDLGRYGITGDPADAGRFRTPSLRGVARTAPYMHNGLIPSLDGMLRMYNVGMPRPRRGPDQRDDPLFPAPDPLLQPLDLSREEIDAIVDFLEQT
ncbi:cytochrome-c peroxidase [Luteimonas sp. XNQY3]|nr:cytochrome c peroxidase [Luteimonas sp. XNQY3]MCD9006357.1 cytochrome-c peroxidase [Luteimonas sp. XNQY3]